MIVSADARQGELDRVLAIVSAAADAGEVCPTNPVLAARMGWASVASASRAVADLERAGLVRVERTRVWRIVTIVATGRSTAWNGMGRNPDPEAEARDAARRRKVAITADAQARAEQFSRRAAGLPVYRLAIRPGFSGGPAHKCQWIEGDPARDNSCKCLAPSAPGHSWCAAHLARIHDAPTQARLDRRLGIADATRGATGQGPGRQARAPGDRP